MKTAIIGGILIIAALGAAAYFGTQPGKYDDFAECLTAKGATFYGASWCEHCIAQKKAFGKSAKYLPYVECSTPDRQQTRVCQDEKIESYPTWKFSDGTMQTGVPTFAQLSEKTGCTLP